MIFFSAPWYKARPLRTLLVPYANLVPLGPGVRVGSALGPGGAVITAFRPFSGAWGP